MTSGNSSATIYDMEDARRRKSDAPGADYPDVGAWLAAAREGEGLSLAEAATKTHIRERHLAAIETLELESLPARPYAIGFVRTYAEFLHLDADAVVRRFKSDIGAPVSAEVETAKFEEAARAETSERTDLSLAAIAAIIAFVVWCAWQITLPREVRPLGGERAEAVQPAASPAPALGADSEESALVLLERIEPIYPIGCVDGAKPVEMVSVRFTVTTSGRVVSERVHDTTNACFNDAALMALRRWRYEPPRVDGALRAQYDREVALRFERPS
ncbi:MAG: TonB family protein [Pseudomonadota bacterium]